MKALHTEVYKGHVIAIFPDDGPHEPPLDYEQTKHERSKCREEIKPGAYFVSFERNSTLSNMHHFDKPDEVKPWAEENGYAVFSLYKYEHGSVAYNISGFSCPWDSGQVGFVLIKNDEFPEQSEYGTRAERQEKLASCLCEAVTNWCNGWYVGYVVYKHGEGIDEDGTVSSDFDDADQQDSCWGFDDQDYALSETKSLVDACETERVAAAAAYEAAIANLPC